MKSALLSLVLLVCGWKICLSSNLPGKVVRFRSLTEIGCHSIRDHGRLTDEKIRTSWLKFCL